METFLRTPLTSYIASNFDSNIEVILQAKLTQQLTSFKKLITIISLPEKLPDLSYHLINTEKWIYLVILTDSNVTRRQEHPNFLSLEVVDANIDIGPFSRTYETKYGTRIQRQKKELRTWAKLRPTIYRLCGQRELPVNGRKTHNNKSAGNHNQTLAALLPPRPR